MTGPLRSFYRAQKFNPGWAGIFVNPFFLARRQLWREVSSMAGEMKGRLLDVGCGSKPYRSCFAVDSYVGLEIDTQANRERGQADVFYDGHRFPFPDGAFESIVCNQVLEHVFNPDEFVSELCRVLVPGGRVLITVPFVWDEHEQPFDYARYSSFGLKALLNRHGLQVLSQRKTLADASVIAQLANAYLQKVLSGRIRGLNLLWCVIVHAPISLLGLASAVVLPRNPDLYLDQVVLAERSS